MAELPMPWWEALQAAGMRGEAVDGWIVVDMTSYEGEFYLRWPADGAPHRLRVVGNGQDIKLDGSSAQEPGEISIEEPGSAAFLVRVDRLDVRHLAICRRDVEEPDHDSGLVSLVFIAPVQYLSLSGVNAQFGQPITFPDVVEVHDSTLAVFGSEPMSLVASGSSAVTAAGRVHATAGSQGLDRLTLRSPEGGQMSADLESLPVGAAICIEHSTVEFTSLPIGMRLELDSGEAIVRGDGTHVRVSGTGRVTLDQAHALLIEPEFSDGIDLLVHDAQVIEATGVVGVLTMSGSAVVTARGDGSFSTGRVIGGEGAAAELDDVSVYELDERDLIAIDRSCTRFRPWFAPSRKERRRRERGMGHGNAAAATRPERAVSFWSRLHRMLDERGSAGDTMSKVREAHLRSRLQSTSRRSREGALLRIYNVFGFGEVLLIPLAWYLGAALVGFGVLSSFDAAAPMPWWELLLRLLVAPLGILRVEVALPSHPGLWDDAVSAGLKAFGAATLATVLLTARRLARGE